MRKIKTKDVFRVGRLIKDSGVKDELMQLYEARHTNGEVFGVDMIFRVIDVFSAANMEQELYTIYGDIVEKTAEEVEDTDLDVLESEFNQINKENNLKHFFDAVSKWIQ